MQSVVLEMKNISKRFSKTQALKEIHFELRQGEVHALLGENGAGKSTLIKVLGGIHQPDEGEILIEGQSVKMENVHAAQQAGVGIIHQEIVLVPHLSIAENIFLGREPVTRLGLRDKRRMNEQAQEMIHSLGLSMDVETQVDQLTIAQQQMVEIVKAVSFNAKILVMDEPTSSLSEDEVNRLFEIIHTLKKQNVSIIYISHRMEELFRISDRITVIRDGTYVGTRITSQTNPDELVAMMVGRSLESFYVRTFTQTGEEVLRAERLCQEGRFRNISFSVSKGEILGFSGLIGAGRSEVMSAIFGGTELDSGRIFIHGEPVRIRDTHDAIVHKIAMVPEDRKKLGLSMVGSVGFNLTLAALDSLLVRGLISPRKRKDMVEDSIRSFHIKTASTEIDVASLSGGNQQKVVVGKWMATNPDLLILDEPTRGVDVGAKQEIYNIINQLACQGVAIIMVSSDLPEIINMCNRVCVMREGELVAELNRQSITQENIMKYATGGSNDHE